MKAIKYTDKFDFEFDDEFEVKLLENSHAVANMLRFDLECNANWVLGNSIGVDWANINNTGLLQITNPDVYIVQELSQKILRLDGIREIESIVVRQLLDRSYAVDISIIALSGEIIDFTIGGGN